MTIDARNIINKLKGEEPPRKRVSLYLNKELLADFKNSCGDLSASKVMEELMRQFIKSVESGPKAENPALSLFLEENHAKLNKLNKVNLDRIEKMIDASLEGQSESREGKKKQA